MKREEMDFEKLLAVLAQPKEELPPLENAEMKRIEIPYITKEKKVEIRPVRLFLPKDADRPVPLVFVAHYEMGEDSLELRAYLEKGWAVSSVADFDNKYNGQLADDDLVFNNAAFYTLRHLPEIDPKRIGVVGGSAGGYMALMLNALQHGICCSIANCPVTNIYFNFYLYFNEANRLNQKAMQELVQAERVDYREDPVGYMRSLSKLPLPILGAVSGMFQPILDHFPDKHDLERWEAFSPTALAEWFCNPLMVNHFTSDALVPLDQVSRRYSYEKPGDSLPEDFKFRLPKDLPGKLGYSLEERLPAEETRVECIPALDSDEDGILPYDADKRFNINIFDEGPIEGYASHRIQPGTGRADDTPYLEEMFKRTSARTNVLTPEKLRMLLERYQGRSVQLPAHEGIDDHVYGSLAVYRKEVVELIGNWLTDNSDEALEAVFEETLAQEADPTSRIELQNTMTAVKRQIG